MGSRKGIRAQEEQAQQNRELSGASAGSREPDSDRRPIEPPPQDEASRSAIASDRFDDSDDIEAFEDGDVSDEKIDEENDLA